MNVDKSWMARLYVKSRSMRCAVQKSLTAQFSRMLSLDLLFSDMVLGASGGISTMDYTPQDA